MNKRQVCVFAMIVVMVALLSGCAFSNHAAKKTELHTVTDYRGQQVTLPLRPQRIVPLGIGADEILWEMVGPERLAALTFLSDDAGISNISAASQPFPHKVKASLESVIACKPDIVFVPEWQPPELIQTLRDAGIPVYVYHSARTIDEVKTVIQEFGRLTGEEANAAEMIRKMDVELEDVAARIRQIPPEQRKKVVRLSVMGGSGGSGSTFDDICQRAGVINGASAAGVSREEVMTKEQLVAQNPDILLMPNWDYNGKSGVPKYRQEVASDPALQSITAIREQQLVDVPDRYLYCTAQSIVKAVREVAKAAYPRAFE